MFADRRPLFKSTPSRAPRRQVQQHKAHQYSSSKSRKKSSYVDMTGVSEIDMESGAFPEHVATFTKCQTVNEHFASIPSNPFGLSRVESGSSSCKSDSDSEELSRLATILNQSDNSDEADSGEHIDSYSESAEVLGNADNGETASTDELNLNETTLTATSVSVCDDVDDPNTSHDFCVMSALMKSWPLLRRSPRLFPQTFLWRELARPPCYCS